ncbi:hypothetical protein CRENBAI_022670 [Crenichthys baileyi]|uniref:Uncharacterized protein n=1 Tax=Crenichthys baileyi TaxID=28760 RepID=A0AAV9R2X2_9TELE
MNTGVEEISLLERGCSYTDSGIIGTPLLKFAWLCRKCRTLARRVRTYGDDATSSLRKRGYEVEDPAGHKRDFTLEKLLSTGITSWKPSRNKRPGGGCQTCVGTTTGVSMQE